MSPRKNPGGVGIHAISAIILLAVTIGLLQPCSTWARPEAKDIQIEGVFGFGGFYKTQTPSPLVFRVSNSGELLEGWALADMQEWIPPTYYRYPLVITPGGSQRAELACYGCISQTPCEIPLEIRTEDGSLIKRESLTSYEIQVNDTLVVHLCSPVDDLGNLRVGGNPGLAFMTGKGVSINAPYLSYPPSILSVVLQPEELPANPILFDSVGLIAMTMSTYMSLGQETRDTLFKYVRQGGNLLVYYVDGVDRVTGWPEDPLLPARPLGARVVVDMSAFQQAAQNALSQNPVSTSGPTNPMGYGRGEHGEIVPGPPSPATAPFPQWNQPGNYTVVAVTPRDDSETFTVGPTALLAVRLIGSGRAGFAAFDPFIGGPTSADAPIMLLASHGLLSPYGPAVWQMMNNTSNAVSMMTDSNGVSALAPPAKTGQHWFLRWVNSVGVPVLIYLLGLPILALISRGRGHVALALFIGWSVAMTVIAMYRRALPVPDEASFSEASFIWCSALPESEAANSQLAPTRSASLLLYSAETPAPRTIRFPAPDAILDEFVDPTRWPYGSVTIGEDRGSSLPGLPLEQIPMGSARVGGRTFTYDREIPEFTATGQLSVSPSRASLKLDASLPFPMVSGRLVVNTQNMWIGKDLGPLEGSVHIDADLVEGAEITRSSGLFQGSGGTGQGQNPQNQSHPAQSTLEGFLKMYWDNVVGGPVAMDQRCTMSDATGRPGKAYVILASRETPTEIMTDRGEITRQALTIAVISIPVAYEENPSE